MTFPDGAPAWLPAIEEALVTAALFCTAEEVRAQGLSFEDFRDPQCGKVWRAALKTDAPSILTVGAQLGTKAVVVMQRWYGEYSYLCSPEALGVHAEMVKAESVRRKRLRALGEEAAAVGRGEVSPWWTAYESGNK